MKLEETVAMSHEYLRALRGSWVLEEHELAWLVQDTGLSKAIVLSKLLCPRLTTGPSGQVEALAFLTAALLLSNAGEAVTAAASRRNAAAGLRMRAGAMFDLFDATLCGNGALTGELNHVALTILFATLTRALRAFRSVSGQGESTLGLGQIGPAELDGLVYRLMDSVGGSAIVFLSVPRGTFVSWCEDLCAESESAAPVWASTDAGAALVGRLVYATGVDTKADAAAALGSEVAVDSPQSKVSAADEASTAAYLFGEAQFVAPPRGSAELDDMSVLSVASAELFPRDGGAGKTRTEGSPARSSENDVSGALSMASAELFPNTILATEETATFVDPSVADVKSVLFGEAAVIAPSENKIDSLGSVPPSADESTAKAQLFPVEAAAVHEVDGVVQSPPDQGVHQQLFGEEPGSLHSVLPTPLADDGSVVGAAASAMLFPEDAPEPLTTASVANMAQGDAESLAVCSASLFPDDDAESQAQNVASAKRSFIAASVAEPSASPQMAHSEEAAPDPNRVASDALGIAEVLGDTLDDGYLRVGEDIEIDIDDVFDIPLSIAAARNARLYLGELPLSRPCDAMLAVRSLGITGIIAVGDCATKSLPHGVHTMVVDTTETLGAAALVASVDFIRKLGSSVLIHAANANPIDVAAALTVCIAFMMSASEMCADECAAMTLRARPSVPALEPATLAQLRSLNPRSA
jgi:hypothetical protein